MADRGSVGVRFENLLGPQAAIAGVSPYWFSGTSVGRKFENVVGPQAAIGGRVIIGVPPDLIPPIIANYGQAAGGISIY
jgi:hypothetical protein